MEDNVLEVLNGFAESIMEYDKEPDLSENDFFWRLSSNGNTIFCGIIGDTIFKTIEELCNNEFLKGNRQFEELLQRLKNCSQTVPGQS